MVSIIKPFFKSIIPSQSRQRLRSFQRKLNAFFLPLWASSPLMSSFLYGLLSRTFDREHYGVLTGKLQYGKDIRAARESQFLLRRNIHRLEKGLISKPRRDVFAVGYIEETVNAYSQMRALSQVTLEPETEARWAHDVLAKYFGVTSSHPVLDRARSTFEALEPPPNDARHLSPYKRNLTEQPVSYDAFLSLTHRRRSVRWYLDRPVPRQKIDQAIIAAVQSPSACNRLPFEFRIFDTPELVQKVAAVPGGTVGFSQNFPAIVVVVGKLNAYFAERDRHLIYIDASLAAMTFMYALETLGLSSCPINWPDVRDKETKLSRLLNLSPFDRPVMFIAVGYPDPDGLVPYSQKKPLEHVRSYNQL